MARLCLLHLADSPPGSGHTPPIHLSFLWVVLLSLLKLASTRWCLFWCSDWALSFIALGPMHSLYPFMVSLHIIFSTLVTSSLPLVDSLHFLLQPFSRPSFAQMGHSRTTPLLEHTSSLSPNVAVGPAPVVRRCRPSISPW